MCSRPGPVLVSTGCFCISETGNSEFAPETGLCVLKVVSMDAAHVGILRCIKVLVDSFPFEPTSVISYAFLCNSFCHHHPLPNATDCFL